MRRTNYDTFRTSEQATVVFDELLRQGASLLDLAIISLAAYHDEEPDTIDGTRERGCSGSEPNPVDGSDPLGIPNCLDPFENAPCGVRILDNLFFPGDLANCLHVLGFSRPAADRMEDTVLLGGAILISRLPSGNVSASAAKAIVDSFGGTPELVSPFTPYLA